MKRSLLWSLGNCWSRKEDRHRNRQGHYVINAVTELGNSVVPQVTVGPENWWPGPPAPEVDLMVLTWGKGGGVGKC